MVTATGRYRSNQWLLLGTGVIEIIVQAPTAKFGGGTLAIDGYRIPAGAVVASLTYLIHQHPESWPNPKQFDPERFAPQAESVTRRHPFAWIPFGAGQRLCIGRDFALVEGTLALAMVAQRFTMSAIPSQLAQPGLSTTLSPKHGVWVQLSSR